MCDISIRIQHCISDTMIVLIMIASVNVHAVLHNVRNKLVTYKTRTIFDFSKELRTLGV